MGTTILGGNVQVDYLGDERQKRLSWAGTAAATNTMNELYSAMATLLDEDTTIDDGTCFSAETPVEYTIGKIDAGDTEPWYITFDCMEHITGGALKTSGWTRAVGTNTGVVCVPVDSAAGTIVATDAGNTISNAAHSGTLLEFIDTGGATDYLIIRPDTSASGDNWDAGSGTCTEAGLSHTAVQNAVATTGEQIWANLYSIGTIESGTHIYLYQGDMQADERARVYSRNDDTQDWWTNGHIDICVAIQDITAAGWTAIDGGYITVLARQYGKLYDNFEVGCSTTSGGRNPIPLATASDLDNTTGLRTITGVSKSGSFSVGDEISGATTDARGIITKITGDVLQYYIIEDPLTDLNGTERIDNETDQTSYYSSSSTAGAIGPSETTFYSETTLPTVAFGTATADIDDTSVSEDYGINIDCKGNPLTEVYEWIKWACRRGDITTDMHGLEGEQYIGGEVYLYYGDTETVNGTITEGDELTQEGTGASGILISHNADTNIMLLRNVRGTFDVGGAADETITSTENSGNVEMDSADSAAVAAFSPKKQAPLGTFAGGTFFGARGVLISNWHTDDENSFYLTPIEGGTVSRPTAITFSVTNLVGTDETTDDDDRVAVFRLDGDGGSINKTEYACAGTDSTRGTSIDCDGSPSITQDTPGKATGGILIFVDTNDGGKEYKLRYHSWSGDTFNLSATELASAEGGTNTTTIVGADVFGDVERGDIVVNHTRGLISYVQTRDTTSSLTIYPAITGQTTADWLSINCLPREVHSGDKMYVPFIHRHALAATASVSVIYNSTIYYRVKVRNTRASTKIKPFSADGTCSGSDVSVATIRTEDTVYT